MALRPIDIFDVDYIVSTLQNMRKELDVCAESPDDPEYVREQLNQMIRYGYFIGCVSPDQGFMFGMLAPAWYDPRPKAIEMLLYVHPEFRKSSFASKLITRFVSEARAAGACEVIAGTSLGYRTDAVERLYHKHGFVTTGANLKLKLE
jgi:GNAT superfamily N-acetyltransferase